MTWYVSHITGALLDRDDFSPKQIDMINETCSKETAHDLWELHRIITDKEKWQDDTKAECEARIQQIKEVNRDYTLTSIYGKRVWSTMEPLEVLEPGEKSTKTYYRFRLAETYDGTYWLLVSPRYHGDFISIDYSAIEDTPCWQSEVRKSAHRIAEMLDRYYRARDRDNPFVLVRVDSECNEIEVVDKPPFTPKEK